MKFKGLIFGMALVCLVSFSAFVADDDPFALLLKKLDEFAKKYPQEKVHLHLDKPYYAIGDNIWFKAYVTDARTSLPTTTSNILYVELINDRDSVTTQLKLPMQSGITWGDFKLSDTLSEGNYRIRAYTQWMRNAGPSFFFDKTIKIGNAWTNKVFTKTDFNYYNENNVEQVKTTIKFANGSAEPFSNAAASYQVMLGNKKTGITTIKTDANGEINITVQNATNTPFTNGRIIATITLPDGQKVVKKIPIKTTSSAIDVQFFAEGGNFVEGLPNKIAFKAINSAGLGEKISGIIIDNEGTEILTFESTHLGMGAFSISPIPGKTYTAKVKFANDSEKTILLPKAETSGYALAVNNLDSTKMGIKIMMSQDLLHKGELHLLAQRNGNVLFSVTVPSEKQIASVMVPKTAFPSGLVQLTLFNSQDLPVCERLTFVNNLSDKIEVDLQNFNATYGKKTAVALSLAAKNSDKPVQGSFSVAITNVKMVTPDLENESHILTNLLLTSDLTGHIEKPNFYFLNKDIKTLTALDHLMLTQGWRKLDWQALKSSQFPAPGFPAEKSMKISGIVTDNGNALKKSKVSLMSSSKVIFATDTLTDANGRFNFDQIAFRDSTSFTLKAVSSTGHKGVKITMDHVPDQKITVNKNTGDIEINVNESIKTYLKESVAYFNDQESKGFLHRTNQLKAVEIVAKATKASPLSANRNGPGKAEAVFDAEDLKNTISLNHFLEGRISGIILYEQRYFLSKNNPGMDNGIRVNPPEPMKIIIDGMEIINPGFNLDDIPATEVESIEILKSVATTTAYGTTDGIILITLKPGKERTVFNTRAPGMMVYFPKGFYPVRQFYSPKYEVKTDEKPDFRTTVFWEPNLVTDATGKAIINYYNTDQSGNYRIVIEGIDGNGNLARKVYTYEIK